MRQWLSDLIAKNRRIGPKPSGLCLWQNIDALAQLTQALAADRVVRQTSWDEIDLEIKRRTGTSVG